jgi:hypothetical protein
MKYEYDGRGWVSESHGIMRRAAFVFGQQLSFPSPFPFPFTIPINLVHTGYVFSGTVLYDQGGSARVSSKGVQKSFRSDDTE